MMNLKLTDYDQLVYQKELKPFLPHKIIDFHTHVGKASFETEGKPNGGSTWINALSSELLVEDLLDSYKIMFPANQVTPLVFGDCNHKVNQVNAYVRETSAKYGFPALLRTSYEMTGEELEQQIKEGGFLGIKPYQTFCPPYLPANEIRIFDFLPHEHLEICNRNGWIVMLHIPRAGRLKDPVNLAQLLEIEERYPNLKLVVAHIGRAYAREDIGNAFDLLGKTKNMYFDFTANLCDDAITACIQAVGPRRLLFGSDLPIAFMRMYRIVEKGVYYNVVPRGLYGDVTEEPHMRETDETNVTLMIYEQLLALKRCAAKLQLKDQDVEDILYGNAERLLKET